MRGPFNTDWTDVPRIDKFAEPSDFHTPDERVIFVARARIRRAEIRDQYFEVDPDKPDPYQFHGRTCIRVQCLWYGRKPPTSWMHLTILGGFERKPRYRGKVVTNIAR